MSVLGRASITGRCQGPERQIIDLLGGSHQSPKVTGLPVLVTVAVSSKSIRPAILGGLGSGMPWEVSHHRCSVSTP